ncbi:hypothetical protein V2J09_008923 [Rumex salicifolius]
MIELMQLYVRVAHFPRDGIIQYVPYVADSERAMDEYTSEIFMGGRNTIVLHKTPCWLLPSSLIWSSLLSSASESSLRLREGYKLSVIVGKFHSFNPVPTILSYLTKAPLVPPGTQVVNALSKQRAMLENILRACVGLAPENNMILKYNHDEIKFKQRMDSSQRR